MCPLLVQGFYSRLECIGYINKVIDWLIDWPASQGWEWWEIGEGEESFAFNINF